jgi:hypothetical protein
MRIRGLGNLLGTPTSPIPAAQAWQATTNPLQSSYAGAFAGFPQPPTPANDTPDCIFDIPDQQTVANNTTYAPAPGEGWIYCTTAGVLFQVNINGTWTTIFTCTTTQTPIWFVSDFVNFRVNNTSGGSATVTMIRIR